MTQDIVNMCSAVFADFNPRHSPNHQQPIAHGFFSLARVPSLAQNLNPYDLIPGAECTLMAIRSPKFYKPVRVGSRIHCLGRIAGVEKVGRGIKVLFHWIIETGQGKRACEGTYELLYRYR